MGNIGEVKGRDVVIVDELIDTGGTLGALPRRLRKAGAKVFVCLYVHVSLPLCISHLRVCFCVMV